MRCFILAALLTVASGCGSGKPVAIPATGKVTYKGGVPAAGALVVFHPANPDAEKRISGKPFAKVQDDGSFSLTTFAKDDGAPEGEYGVTIDWQKKEADTGFSMREGSGGKSVLDPRFSDPNKPFTKVTVKKGEANSFAFDVE